MTDEQRFEYRVKLYGDYAIHASCESLGILIHDMAEKGWRCVAVTESHTIFEKPVDNQ